MTRVLAIDIGGTHISCGLVAEKHLLASEEVVARGPERLGDLLPAIGVTLQALLQRCDVRASECAGIGIGFPGIVDARDSSIHSTLKKYEDAPSLDFRGWAHSTFGLSVRIENDARLALMGEQFAGAAAGSQNVVMMTLGTGIGTAAILQGQLLRGAHAHAGSLGGHMAAKFDGRTCHCGNIGCAEAEASGWSMPLVVREWPGFEHSSLSQSQRLGFRDLFEHAAASDAVAVAVRDRCLRVWSANAVSLVHAYDPEIVVLGGGVMRSAEMIVPFVQQYIDQHTWSSWGKAQVKAAALGNEAALLGVLPLVMEEMHGPAV
jgi:glucokinase